MIAISSVHSIGLSIRILISASINEYLHCAQLLTDAEAFYQWKKKLLFIESSKLSTMNRNRQELSKVKWIPICE